MSEADVLIVGGGIVGLATAYQLTGQFPDMQVTILDKEAELGVHQTGHNSGVLHSGIYYKPGSLRAMNCRTGKRAMEEFCEAEGVAYDICGKVIVAVQEDELPRLDQIYQRGLQNEVRCEMIGPERLAELEPHTAGIQAIHVPEAGICNFRQVCLKLAERLRERGATIQTSARVKRIRQQSPGVVVESQAGDFQARWLVNCAGLHSDRVARQTGFRAASKIVPFRGEFYGLKPHAQELCRNLIYPVPDPRFPFLGVHFTRMIEGGVECGPNAVLAFAREGYRKRDVNLYDLAEALTYPGFLRLACRHWRAGCGELWRSFNKRAFVRALQRLVPGIRSQDLVASRAGVRAQAVSPNGQLVDDFKIRADKCIVNVDNAPSPAATSALNIGRLVVETLAQQM